MKQSMRSGALCLLAISVVVVLTGVPLAGHHAIAAKFDPNKPVTLNGAVVGIDWANPHVHLLLDVKSANAVTNWAIELESPVDLQRSGWNQATLKPGDVVTVQGISARDGSKQAWANSVVVAGANKRHRRSHMSKHISLDIRMSAALSGVPRVQSRTSAGSPIPTASSREG